MPVSLSATYDPNTTIGVVRMLLMDVDLTVVPTSPTLPPRKQWTVVFADEEIAATINRYASFYDPLAAIYYATAELLESMANNNAWLEKRIKVGDYEKDTKSVGDSIGKRAKAMRDLADRIPAEMITDVAWTDANYARYLYNQFIAGM